MTWTVIRNPKASAGKGARHWPKIENLLRAAQIEFVDHETQHPRHAIALTREAIAAGARRFIAVGGDGTVNEVANGILNQDIVDSKDILLTQIPIGTGNDWGRTVGIPANHKKAIAVIQAGQTLLQDVGLVEWEQDGQPMQRYFVNMAGMGYNAFVGQVANDNKAAGKGGIMGYVSALLSCLMKFQATDVSFEIDGTSHATRKVFSLVVGICKYNGGGMKQCPDAVYDDGLLDVTIVNNISKPAVIRNVPRLFTGKFVKHKAVEQHRGARIALQTDPEYMLEVDGENIGKGSATFSVEPKRLCVIGTP